MFRKVIYDAKPFQLEYSAELNDLYLVNDKKDLVKAKFSYDASDGATILSAFHLLESNSRTDVKIMADLVSDYLASRQDRCKLFCVAKEYSDVFSGVADYRNNNIDRLMLRESIQVVADNFSENIRIEKLTSTNDEEQNQMLSLLQQTYWAKDADLAYVKKAIASSTIYVARNEQNKIIGLARYIANHDIAYISDMVVDAGQRRNGIATLIMNSVCNDIDASNSLTALLSAREGDGKDAAGRLYGDKFGFVDYNQTHKTDIQFRYIRFNPELANKLIANSMFGQKQTSVSEAAQSLKPQL